MIRVSRSGHPHDAPERSNAKHLWHGACIPLLSGCLYVAPVWREPVDLPPEILLPDVGPGGEIEFEFRAASETFLIVAQDPEGQSLKIVWQVPRGIVATPNTFEEAGAQTVSELTLEADPVLDDSYLSVTIFDPGGNDADLSWHLVVP